MDLPITTDPAQIAAGLPEGLQAEDLRQACVALSSLVDAASVQAAVETIAENELNSSRLRRACDVLNFLSGQLASVEAFTRVQTGAQQEGITNESD